jgi:hypothetical protein
LGHELQQVHAVQNIKDYNAKTCPGVKLAKHASGPFPTGYIPELDTTPKLNDKDATFYQSKTSVLCWCVELGRVDIITEVSTLLSHLALPHEGHLEALLHLFAYLDKKHNARIIFDPLYPTINMTVFKECDWKHFYGNVHKTFIHIENFGMHARKFLFQM